MLPLNGVRIIAVEQYGAGPMGSLFLASLGAEIIKVENPRDGGDVSRSVGPHFAPGVDASAASLFFQGLNHNKKSLTLDLSRPEGKTILQSLVATADALTSNVRGDVASRLGITYEQLAQHNPRLVCAHITGFGRDGPRAAWPGYDYMMQAEAGYFSLTGEPDGPPARFGLSIVDFMSGLALAYGVTAGLLDARRSGVGRDIDVSLFDIALYNLNYVAMWVLNAGAMPERLPRSSHLSLAPCQLYKTQDGFIYVMCQKEKFWQALCDEVGRPQLKTDSRFENFRARHLHRNELTPILDEALSTDTTERWLARFAGIVPAAPVYSVPQALTNPFVAESDRIMSVPVDGGPNIRVLRPPVRCGEPAPAPVPAPTLGEHTEDILRQLGYDETRIGELRSRKII